MQPLKQGDAGGAVAGIQRALNLLRVAGPEPLYAEPLNEDGRYGPKTEHAVRTFQASRGLTVTGTFGGETKDALFPLSAAIGKPEPKRGKVIQLVTAQVLARADACVGAPIHYHLEYPNGGSDPQSPMPCDVNTGGLDCSGFNAWVLGFDRFQKGKFDFWGGYLNTDSKIAEAEQDGLWFTVQTRPEPGDLIVGETYRNVLGRKVIGHEGIVTEADEWDEKGLDGILVIHCSSSNAKAKGNHSKSAVWKTSGAVWKRYKKLRFLRFNRDYALSL